MSWSSWHTFFVSSFFSSDFTDESEAFLLIGLLTEFRGYLASGQWLAPYICSCCFCHADFADGADFSSWGLFCPTDFADIHRFFFVEIISSHRFHRYTQIFLCGDYFVPQISQMTQIFLCGTYSNSRGYLHRPDRSPPWKSVSNCLRRKSPNKFRVIRWIKKICVICEICVTLKNVPRKICVYLWNLWDFFQAQGYLHRPNRSPLRKSVINRLIRNTSE